MEDLLDKPDISIIEDDITDTLSSSISVANAEPLVQNTAQSSTGKLLHVLKL